MALSLKWQDKGLFMHLLCKRLRRHLSDNFVNINKLEDFVLLQSPDENCNSNLSFLYED